MKHATPMETEAIRKLVEEPGRPLSEDEWLKYVELLGKLIWFVQHEIRHYIRGQQDGIFHHGSVLEPLEGFAADIRLLSRTIDHGITYGGNNEHAKGVKGSNIDYYSIDHGIEGHVGAASLQDGEAFSDTDYATDPRDRKSILGFVFMV